MTELVTTATGSVLAVQWFGPATGGSPILVVPGWCCGLASVEPLVTLLATRRPVVVVDLPGHGASPAPPTLSTSSAPAADLSLASLASDVLGVVAALGLERPVVAGHSMGGLIALGCASRPDLVAAAVLLDPAPIVAPRAKEFFGRSTAEVAADRDGAWRRRFIERLIPGQEVPGRADVIAAFVGAPARARGSGVPRHGGRRRSGSPGGGARPGAHGHRRSA